MLGFRVALVAIVFMRLMREDLDLTEYDIILVDFLEFGSA